MKPAALVEMVKAKPFRPFVIHMAVGGQCEVLCPMVIVTETSACVGTPAADGPPGLAERISMLSLDHIERITLIGDQP